MSRGEWEWGEMGVGWRWEWGRDGIGVYMGLGCRWGRGEWRYRWVEVSGGRGG